MNLRLAKVVKVHPEHRAVDLVYLDNGWHAAGAQVLAPTASTCTGLLDLPAPIVDDTKPWDTKMLEQRDLLAVVAQLGTYPVVLGFLLPQVSQMVFERPNFRVDRHASDVYSTIADNGDAEFYHPSGTYVRVGASPAHEDLTGKDYDQEWKIERNTGAAAHFKLSANGGKATVHIDPAGNITVTAAGEIHVRSDKRVEVVAPMIDLNP